MKDSELLKIVRNDLLTFSDPNDPDSSNIGLCRLINTHSHKVDQCSSLLNWIESMMGGDFSHYLDDWLIHKGYLTEDEWEIINFSTSDEGCQLREKLKVTRLAWLDWMIAECEKAEAIK